MYEVYTDGSTKGNGKAVNCGGWAFAITQDNVLTYQSSGTATQTTNQKMELTACLEALKYCSQNLKPPFTIYSDSAYLINCYKQKWYENWERNGWRNAKREPVANQELWKQIIPYFRNKEYNFCKVKGHADNQYNNIVDKLAQNAAEGV